jgi:formate dehydrogenase major subunit
MKVDHSRLTQPLVRAEGELRPASWEHALDLVARRFAELKARYGPDVFGCYSCSKTTNELNFLAQKFTRAVIGTNNVDSCNRT